MIEWNKLAIQQSIFKPEEAQEVIQAILSV
jgi:hypothetical protein